MLLNFPFGRINFFAKRLEKKLVHSNLGLPHLLEYFNDYVKRSLRCFEYFFVCLVLIGSEIILLYKELRCIDGSLYRGPTVSRKLVIKRVK